jgi:hypothetical protein
MAVPTDVSDEDQANHLVKMALEAFGTIDILVNNAAGRSPFGPIHQISLPEWEQTLKINLTGAFLCTKVILPVLMEKREGKIINVVTTLTPYMVVMEHLVGDSNLQEPIGGQAGCQHHPVDIKMGRPGFRFPALRLKPEILDCFTQIRVFAQSLQQRLE